jgi:uncharacterized membrane protein
MSPRRKRRDGMRLVIVEVPSRDAGLDALDRLRAAQDEGRITVEDAALVYRDADRSVKVHQTRDAGAGIGAMRGGLVGLAVGIIAAPAVVLATAAGAGVGAVAAKLRDGGVNDAMLRRLGDLLEGREAAVVVLADEASAQVLTDRIDELAGRGAALDYEVLPPEAQDLIREAIEQGLGTG